MKITGPTDPNVRVLIEELRRLANENDAPIWRRAADDIGKPRRKRVEVNVGEIDKHSKDKDIVLIPGKVLGSGLIRKEITVIALDFSDSASKKIEAAGGKAKFIADAINEHPQGNNIRVMH